MFFLKSKLSVVPADVETDILPYFLKTGTKYSERIKSFTDQGYIVIGQSVFQGTWEPRYLAVQAARQYGADIVVITSKQESELIKTVLFQWLSRTLPFIPEMSGDGRFMDQPPGYQQDMSIISIKRKFINKELLF